MDNFLKKIKLAEDFSLKLDISKTEFTNKLSKNIAPESMFATLFKNKGKLFIGSIDSNSISVRPRGRSGNSNFSYASQLNAKYSSNSQKVLIDGTLQISRKYFIMMLAPALFYFAVVIPIFAIQTHSLTMLAVILVQFIFMIVIFYFILRKAITISKVYFEKELLSIIKRD